MSTFDKVVAWGELTGGLALILGIVAFVVGLLIEAWLEEAFHFQAMPLWTVILKLGGVTLFFIGLGVFGASRLLDE